MMAVINTKQTCSVLEVSSHLSYKKINTYGFTK
jgi:hypothetical protein